MKRTGKVPTGILFTYLQVSLGIIIICLLLWFLNKIAVGMGVVVHMGDEVPEVCV